MTLQLEPYGDATFNLLLWFIVGIFPILIAFTVVGIVIFLHESGIWEYDTEKYRNVDEVRSALNYLKYATIFIVFVVNIGTYVSDKHMPFQSFLFSYIIAYLIMLTKFMKKEDKNDEVYKEAMEELK